MENGEWFYSLIYVDNIGIKIKLIEKIILFNFLK